MKRLVMSIALACLLTVSALAGEIPTGGFNAPPPDETTPTSAPTAPGEIPTTDLTQEESEAALALVQMLLGVVG